MGVVAGVPDLSPLTQGRGLKLVPAPLIAINRQSPLTQGRGLKLPCRCQQIAEVTVAPHTGAWIETGARTDGALC